MSESEPLAVDGKGYFKLLSEKAIPVFIWKRPVSILNKNVVIQKGNTPTHNKINLDLLSTADTISNSFHCFFIPSWCRDIAIHALSW